jgi:hypothetical protein
MAHTHMVIIFIDLNHNIAIKFNDTDSWLELKLNNENVITNNRNGVGAI